MEYEEYEESKFEKYLVILGTGYNVKGSEYKKGMSLVIELKPVKFFKIGQDYIDRGDVDFGHSSDDIVIKLCPAIKILYGVN